MSRLLKAIEAQHGEQLTFDVEDYWNVPISEAYELDRQPGLDVGQISDDVESVREFSASDEFVAIWHECEHLAGLLRAIAAKDKASFL